MSQTVETKDDARRAAYLFVWSTLCADIDSGAFDSWCGKYSREEKEAIGVELDLLLQRIMIW